MAGLLITNYAGNPFELRPVAQEVWIGGIRRADAYCTELTLQSGAQAGNATIWFPRSSYDAVMCFENDLVEVIVRPFGVLFRGFITARSSELTGRLTYTAMDVLEKFNDTYFAHNYSYRDEVTRAPKYVYTARQVAADAYAYYEAWHAGSAATDYKLSIDLSTFPELTTGELNVMGQPLLAGLAQALDAIDYRYRIKIEHTAGASTIKAFLLGAGAQRRLARGTDPAQPYTRQPHGVSTMLEVTKDVSAANTLTHIWADGDNRVVERAFSLAQDWNLVADDYQPPEGYTIKDFVTASEQSVVINNWETYTVEQLDVKAADKEVTRVKNPNYRRKYERVCTRWRIPLFNDVYYLNDDPNTYPTLLGELNRQVRIEGELVQTYDGKALRPFLVYKRVGDNNLYVQTDGFSIEDSQWVVFDRPFVDTVSTLLAKGVNGSYVAASWDQQTVTSQYTAADAGVDFAASISDAAIAAGCWLVLGEYLTYYRVTARTTDTLTVEGNLDGAGVEDAKGKHWFVTSATPYLASGTSGSGQTGGVYQIASEGGTETTNEYAGAELILGAIDATKGAWTVAPGELKSYRIAYNSQQLVHVDQADADLSEASASWVIAHVRRETKRPYEWVALNCAYSSVQRLTWWSGNVSAVRNKRVVYKQSPQHIWRTEYHNYRLAKSQVPGAEDQYSVTWNDQAVDHVKQLNELAVWAAQQVEGANTYEVRYAITLKMMDFSLALGDRLLDNLVDTSCTVTGIRYDLESHSQQITALSWG